MKEQIKISKLRTKLAETQDKHINIENKIQKRINKEIEKITKIKPGDKCQISKLMIRHKFRNTDIEILGKKGIITATYIKMADILIGQKHYAVKIENLTKIK